MSGELTRLIRAVLGDSGSERAMRDQVLALAREHVHEPEVRAALCDALCSNAAGLDPDQFPSLVMLLAPYVSGERELRARLLEFAGELSGARRVWLLEGLVPQLPEHSRLAPVLAALAVEPDHGRRHGLYALLWPLSTRRYPQLAELYVAELRDPGSPLRRQVATALAAAAAEQAVVVAALEDVLRHDLDRELLRLVLDAYLRPGVPWRFEPLYALVGKEDADLATRKRALEALLELRLERDQRVRIETLVQSLPELSRP